MTTPKYTTQLQAGLGMLEETRVLLDLWEPDMDAASLTQAALDSGRFPSVSARRLRNLVVECFGSRYLVQDARPVVQLKELLPVLSAREFDQVLFLYTCRANAILADFVRGVYWEAYMAARESITNARAREFVVRANDDGKTETRWSDGTLDRVAAYLTRCCADFGLLERGRKSARRLVPYRLELRVATFLAYDLHFAGYGDNRLVADPDWGLFGMERGDVVDELRRLATKGAFIVQSAGDIIRIGWQCKTSEELTHVLAQY